MFPWGAFAHRLLAPCARHDSAAAAASRPELHESCAVPALPMRATAITFVDAQEPALSQNPYETQPLDDMTGLLASSEPRLTLVDQRRQFSAAARCDVGRERSENQDRCFAQMILQPGDDQDHALGLFVVADGMGGHHDGGRAAQLALTTVVQHLLAAFVAPAIAGETLQPQPILQMALQAANTAVYETGQAAASDMGTTCTVALLVDDQLIVAHVGDSRALLLGSGARVLTTDHTAVGRLIAIGALPAEEARDHPLRSQLYRSVGQQPHVAVDIVTVTLRDETHLVLCSDGLWGLVPESDICDIVQEAPTADTAARRLVARANLLGGHDNIAVVVVALPPTGAGL